MKQPNPKRVFISIFLKILFPLFVAMILIHMIVMTTVFPLFRPARPGGEPPGDGPRQEMGRRGPPSAIYEDFDSVIKALGPEPTLEKAREILKSGQDLMFESKTSRWSTSTDLSQWDTLKGFAREPRPGLGQGQEGDLLGLHAGKIFISRKTGTGRMTLFSPFGGPPSPIRTPHFWFVLGLQVTGVLLLSYGILLWQLRHIKKLRQAMNELSQGNLDYRVNINDSGEFGVLGDGFNEMAERISLMLKAKQELLLGVSHELRSPLASANVLLELVGDEKRKHQIKHHLGRMESLVAELLESHRISSEYADPRFETVPIAEMLAGLKVRYETVGPGLQIGEVDPGLTIDVDPRYFERLLTNLIENAQKYSAHSNDPVNIAIHEQGDQIRIDVSDSGPGIPESDIANVFEPFYRVDKSRNRETGGFGLGLYLCSRIVSMHGGQISVTNRPEGGCCFSVLLPYRSSDAAKVVNL